MILTSKTDSQFAWKPSLQTLRPRRHDLVLPLCIILSAIYSNFAFLKVPPAELEAVLLSHSNVEDAAVIGIPDGEAGELPKGFVVRKGEISEEDLQEFVNEKVAPYKKLRGGIVFVEKIPKSASGKILRRELKEKELKQSPELQQIVKNRDVNVLKSKFPDVEIPGKISWSEFVMRNFDQYGDKLALVSITLSGWKKVC